MLTLLVFIGHLSCAELWVMTIEPHLGRVSIKWDRHPPSSPQGIPLGPSSVGDDHDASLTPLAHSGFSYVDLVEGLHDGHFYALKRILCHEQQDREEAQREADMHRLFHHPNILHLVAYCLRERGTKHEAWLLLPFFKVRKSHSYGGVCNRAIYQGLCEQSSLLGSNGHMLGLTTSDLGFRGLCSMWVSGGRVDGLLI